MNYKALVIGVNEYINKDSYGDLAAVSNDVTAISQILSDSPCHYQVTTLSGSEATHVKIKKELDYFFDSNEDDVLFLYWAGHGTRSYFIAHDTDQANEAETAIDLNILASMIEKTYSKAVVIVLDCCCSGAIARGRANYGLQIKGDGKVIMASSDYEEPSLESPSLGHGHFTYCFIQGMKGAAASNSGDVTVTSLHDYICEQITKLSPDKQTPVLKLTVAGLFVLNKVEVVIDKEKERMVEKRLHVLKNYRKAKWASIIMLGMLVALIVVMFWPQNPEPNAPIEITPDMLIGSWLMNAELAGFLEEEELLRRLELLTHDEILELRDFVDYSGLEEIVNVLKYGRYGERAEFAEVLEHTAFLMFFAIFNNFSLLDGGVGATLFGSDEDSGYHTVGLFYWDLVDNALSIFYPRGDVRLTFPLGACECEVLWRCCLIFVLHKRDLTFTWKQYLMGHHEIIHYDLVGTWVLDNSMASSPLYCEIRFYYDGTGTVFGTGEIVGLAPHFDVVAERRIEWGTDDSYSMLYIRIPGMRQDIFLFELSDSMLNIFNRDGTTAVYTRQELVD